MARGGDVIAERFRLEEELGSGAMGSVWRATHLALLTPVAVKLIRAEAARNPDARARFEREALLAARMSSAHVVRAIDHGHHDGLPYIVMEYLEGETLRGRLDARKRLTLVDTARAVRHAGRALSAAHDVGLVHRDIKPENIFVSREDDEEIYRVLDFGVAKVTDELAQNGVDPTRTGALLGTPYYLSPEQARGLKSLDHRADLWSLGVVAFECITGRRPFVGHAIGPLIAQVLHGKVPSLREASGDATLPPELDGWMARALARDPTERFSSAREMADAFNLAAGTGDSLPTDSSASYSAPQATVVFRGQEDLAETVALAGESYSPDKTVALAEGAPDDALKAEPLEESRGAAPPSAPPQSSASVASQAGPSVAPHGPPAPAAARGRRSLALVLATVAVVAGISAAVAYRLMPPARDAPVTPPEPSQSPP